MDEYTQTKASGGSLVGILLAGIVVFLVLVYALFGGGSDGTTSDPAAIGATEDGAPAVQDTTPDEPAAPTIVE